jgi:hypothetical protein
LDIKESVVGAGGRVDGAGVGCSVAERVLRAVAVVGAYL